MLSGDNSILGRGTESKQATEKQQIIENAKVDILAKQIDNKGTLTEQELIDILTSNEYSTKGTLSENDEESVLEKTLTSSDGKYQILVSEIYNGSLTGSSSGGTLSLEALRTKISKKTGDCMIDEEGNIMPINVWRYTITSENTCQLYGFEDSDYEVSNAYGGSVLENGELEHKIPVFIKVNNNTYVVNELGSYALYGIASLKTVDIPDSIESIGSVCFKDCTNLENVDLSMNTSIIGNRAFSFCYKLKEIDIVESVKKIRNLCFRIFRISNINYSRNCRKN